MKLLDVIASPWAIEQNAFVEMLNVYNTHLRGEKINMEGIEARVGASINDALQIDIVSGTAIIPVHGVLTKRLGFWGRLFGGVGMVDIGQQIQAAAANNEVERIILDVDSPGGTVDGTSELADIVRLVRDDKPVIAYVDGLMASAAYWVGSAASEIYISGPTTRVGSIGVISTHIDWSAMDKAFGIKVTEIYAGKFKAVGSPNRPLSDSDRKVIQNDVDYLYSIFVNNVAENRNVSVDTVLNDMADAKVFIGQQAIDAGLVDGVSTLDDLIAGKPGLTRIGLPSNESTDGGTDDIGGDEMITQSGNAETPLTKLNSEEQTMSLKTYESAKALATDYPDLVAAIEETAKADGHSAGLAVGAKAECDRIASVQAQLIPGHEALIETLKFDGKTSGPEAAVQVLAAEKQLGTEALKKIKDGAPAAIDQPAPGSENDKGDDVNMTVDEKFKATWDKDAALRTEFQGDFNAYLGWAKADAAGLVKVKRAS